MNLVALNIDSILMGQPLPFALRGADGVLLARKGQVLTAREELASLKGNKVHVYVDTDESDDAYRSYLGRLQQMLLSQTALGEIAAVKISAAAQPNPAAAASKHAGPPDWPGLQLYATQLLRAPPPSGFVERLQLLQTDLAQKMRRAPDATLLVLIYLSAQEARMYSATHAMLVACVCMLVTRDTLHWPEERVANIGMAALSMNIAMTTLQDQLAVQSDPLTSPQVQAINNHAERSEARLRDLGVTDPAWLEAVRLHHDRTPGKLATRSEGQQMARLIQRADVFGARLAPRATRHPMNVTAAMQASYYDEERQADEAGAALIKTLGIYPPGTFVRLASDEVAIVLRRGPSGTTPRVAAVLNRNGMPTGEPIPRDTALPDWKITGSIARHQVRVQLQLARLLALA